ncbi:MAG: AI-2E family transporter [Acidobacteria bacterium]|nr:AI-2E family transporter [Acidobacteriota bacterium]
MASQHGRSTSERTGIWILAVVATLFFLRAASALLIPIVIAVLISYALEPIVAWLHARHVPRIVGAVGLLLGLVGLAGWGAYSLRGDVSEATRILPAVAGRVIDMIGGSNRVSNARGASTVRHSGTGATGEEAAPVPDRARQPASGRTEQQSMERETANTERSAAGAAPASPGPGGDPGLSGIDLVQMSVGAIVAFAVNLVVIPFLVLFLLLSGHHIRGRLVEVGREYLDHGSVTVEIIDDISMRVQRFLLVRVVASAIVGVVTWLVLAWMDVDHAGVWGFLGGAFDSIPYFGPAIVSGGLLVVGLIQTGSIAEALEMACAALLVASAEGWLVTPALLGRAERMSVIVVFLGILLWTWLWGPWGTLLAVPMLVIVKSVADHVPALRPLGRLMAPW